MKHISLLALLATMCIPAHAMHLLTRATLQIINTKVIQAPDGAELELTLQHPNRTGARPYRASFSWGPQNVHTDESFAPSTYGFAWSDAETLEDRYTTRATLSQSGTVLFRGNCNARIYLDGHRNTSKIFLCIMQGTDGLKVKDPTLGEEQAW